jgi:hypothetical protein
MIYKQLFAFVFKGKIINNPGMTEIIQSSAGFCSGNNDILSFIRKGAAEAPFFPEISGILT